MNQLKPYRRNVLTERQIAQMSHTGQFNNPIPESAQRLRAQQLEIDRQNELALAHSQLSDADMVSAPPLNALLQQPSGFDQAMSRWTGPSEEQNATNALTDVLGSQFAGGLIPAAKQIRTKGIMSMLDPRLPQSQINMIGYHGSPHRINNVDELNPMGKFDLSKIGTGEGAQAYGHGIYLAQDKSVSDNNYRLAGRAVFTKDQDTAAEFVRASGRHVTPENATPAERLIAENLDLEDTKAIKSSLEEQYGQLDQFDEYMGKTADELDDLSRSANWRERPEIEKLQEIREAIEILDAEDIEPFKGYLYEVDLPDEKIAQMLDWDAPLSEQPQAVRDALQNAGLYDFGADAAGRSGDMGARIAAGEKVKQSAAAWMPQSTKWQDLTGGDLIRGLGNDAAASAKLNELGIPGIKYFDGNSRSAGEGTRNFVVFNPDDAKILSRNGEKAKPAALPMDEASRIDFSNKDVIKSEAEKLAEELNSEGFIASVEHSGSKAGSSSYVSVHDPQTGRFIKKPARFSNHSKGAFNNEMSHNMSMTSDLEKFKQLARDMRDQGPSDLIKRQAQGPDEAGLRRIAKSERRKAKQAAKKDSANLMHGIGAIGAGGLMMQDEEKPKTLRDLIPGQPKRPMKPKPKKNSLAMTVRG